MDLTSVAFLSWSVILWPAMKHIYSRGNGVILIDLCEHVLA